MADVYRSGWMLNPPIALAGHTYTMVTPSQPALGDLFPGRPAFWQCHHCYQIRTTGNLPTEPCTGRARALAAPQQPS